MDSSLVGSVIRLRIFKQRGLTGPVSSDDADDLALLDLEITSRKRPEFFGAVEAGRVELGVRRVRSCHCHWLRSSLQPFAASARAPKRRPEGHAAGHRLVPSVADANDVALREVFDVMTESEH